MSRVASLIPLLGLAAGISIGAALIGYSRATDHQRSVRVGRPSMVKYEASLPESQMRELLHLQRVFLDYAPVASVTITEEEECHGFAPLETILLSRGCVTNPAFEDQDKVALYHELAHSLLDHNKEPRNIEEYLRLEDAHSHFKESNFPFDIFDEDSYVKVDPKYGHPGDNHMELFASALTIFRFFPEEFIARYKGEGEFVLLWRSTREGISEVGLAVLDVLQSINPDKPEEMRQILPDYDRIRKVLEEGL